MGLDVSAHINPVPSTDADNDNYTYLRNDKAFESRGGSLAEGEYIAPSVYGFRAGPYSSYNRWRRSLCFAIYGMSDQEFWDSPIADSDQPFAELINFTDCDGYLGPELCVKLAADFNKHREKLEAAGVDMLDEWTELFTKAAEGNGFVEFH